MSISPATLVYANSIPPCASYSGTGSCAVNSETNNPVPMAAGITPEIARVIAAWFMIA